MPVFDPYHQWLGIPPADQPPDHYRLLGVPLFESDLDVIEAAAQRQTVFLRTLQLGPQSELAERLLNEVARARVTLLNTDQKAVYDNKLRQSQPLPADPVPDSDRDALSAEIAFLRKTLEQRDQSLRQGKEDLEQERTELAHQQQRLARGVAALKREQQQQRAQPPHRRLPPARSAGFKSILSRLTDWILSNAVKIAIVVILGGFLFLALFSVSGRLKEPELNVPSDLTEDQSRAAEDQLAEDVIGTENISPEKQLVAPEGESADREDVGEISAVASFSATEAAQHQQHWADSLGTPVETTNKSGMILKLIPPGEFMMGSAASEVGRQGDEAQHRKTITKAFYLSAHEVTQKQYQQVTGKTVGDSEGSYKPVEKVSWNDAVEFCRKLSKQEGEEYRLPTEAEWEYACRAGTNTAYSFAGHASRLGQYAWYTDNSEGTTHAVGAKTPNSWGLYDMHGNVWEWCQDRYDSYASEVVVRDAAGPAQEVWRVLRGGSFNYGREIVRSANRNPYHPGLRVIYSGFRVAKTYDLSPITSPTVEKPKAPAEPPKMSRAKLPLAAPILELMTPEQVDLGGPIVNSIDIVLVPIPPGEFMMGSPESESDHRDNETQHLVRITKPFYLSAHEVTRRQYESVMQVRPWKGKAYVKEGEDYPATHVDRDDAVAFCDELSDEEGVEYRLPTEAQWEYACRGGTTTGYSFGGDSSQLGNYAWYGKNAWGIGEQYAHRVGEKLPNPWGIYDMHGNVWEWCQDWYGPYKSLQVVSDPTGPASGSRRVLRGGAFYSLPGLVRAAARTNVLPGYRLHGRGFRLTRTYPLSPAVTGPTVDKPKPPATPPESSPTTAETVAALEKLGVNVRKIRRNNQGEVVQVVLPKQITDAGLVRLKVLTNLETLSLHGTKITDAGLVHLKVLTNLNSLSLPNQITDEGLVHLQGLTKLETLNLPDRVTDAGLGHLARLTNLRTLNDLNWTAITDAGLAHLAGLTKLTELNLGVTQITDAGLVHLKGLTNLETLSLFRTKITDAGLMHLKVLSKLKDLGISETQVTDAGLVHLAGLTKLTSLSLSGITDAGLVHLAGLTKLQTLYIRPIEIRGSGLAYLNGLNNLENLYLTGAPITDAGLMHLKGLTNLQFFRFYTGAQVTDAGLVCLKGLTSLRVLELNSPQMTDAGLVHLTGMTKLETLNLTGKKLTGSGLAHLKGLTNLQNLTLERNPITDAGLAHLKGLTNLSLLSVSRSEVTDEGLVHIKKLTNLRSLNLWDTRVTDAGVAELKKALPNCHIGPPR